MATQLKAEVKSLRDQSLHEKSIQEHSLNREKEKMKQQLSEMQVRILDHQNSMSALQQEHEQAKDESRSLQEQLSILSTQLCQKDKEISGLRGELELYEGKLQQNPSDSYEQVAQIEELEEKTKERQRELAVTTKELEHVKMQEQSLKTKCSQLETEFTILQSNRETMESLVSNDYTQTMDRKLEQSEASIKSLQQTLKESRQAEINNKTVINQLYADKKEAAMECEALKMANASLKSELVVLETKLHDVEEERRQLKSEGEQLLILQQENAKFSKQLANLRSHLLEVRNYVVRVSETLVLC